MKTRYWYIGLTIVYVAMIVYVIYDSFKGAYYLKSWFQGACIGALVVGLLFVIISWIQYERKAKSRQKLINEWLANKKVLAQKAALDFMEPIKWDKPADVDLDKISNDFADAREYLNTKMSASLYYKGIPLVERLEQIRDRRCIKEDELAIQELIDELKKVGG